MALSNLFDWNRETVASPTFACGSACGADDKFVEDEGWLMTAQNPRATYACINFGEAVCPVDNERQSVCMDSDIGRVLRDLA